MALTTYAELQAAIEDQLARGDLDSQIPDFITLFEAEANRELFRHRLAETSTSLTTSSGNASLPADYMGWRRATYAGSTRIELDYIHPSMLQAYYPTSATGKPQAFTIEGSTFKARPADDTTAIEFGYFAKPAALSASLSWLFTKHPDAYFFGSLEQAYLYVKDYEQSAPWALKKSIVFDQIKKQRFREDGALSIRIMGNTP